MNRSEYQLIEQKNQLLAKINKINLRFKQAIITAILFFILFILFLVLFAAKDCQYDCPIPTNYQNIRLSNTSLEKFQISFANTDTYTQNQLTAHKPSNIIALDLSYNQNIRDFSNNYMPDLRSLNFSSASKLTTFTNNILPKLLYFINWQTSGSCWYQNFSSNYLPLVKQISISGCNLRQFYENNLTSLQNLELNTNQLSALRNLNTPKLKQFKFGYNNMTAFQNNTMPILTKIDDGFRNNPIASIVNNNFGYLSELKIYGNKTSPIFSKNTLSKLKYLSFSQCLSLNFSYISDNYVPSIQQLDITLSPLQEFRYSQSFKTLKTLYLQQTDIQDFSNHNYNLLQKLMLYQKSPMKFQNNSLPALKQWICTGCNFASLCTNNSFQNLQIIDWKTQQNEITNIDCLNNSKNLKNITFQSKSLSQINNFNLPNLKELQISDSAINSFINNDFPSLISFQVISSADNAQFQINSYSQNLQFFRIYSKGSFQLKNKKFPKLKALIIQNINNLGFSNNSFPVIETLTLTGLLQGSDFDPQTKFSANIKYISITHSPKLTSFTYNSTLPNIQKVVLHDNSLNHIDCLIFKNTLHLDLNNNKFDDSVIDRLIQCDFPRIATINLLNNSFAKVQVSRDKLQRKYSKTDVRM